MRFVALALILMSLPIFVMLLKQYRARRDLALTAIAAMLFIGGNLQVDAALITWPLWAGTVRGIQISPVDTLAIALILTRRNGANMLPFLALISLYALTMILSFVAASVPMATLFSCVQLLRVTILFIAIGGELTRPGAFDKLMTGLSLGLLLQAGYVIQQKLGGAVQASGTMYHQNLLGMMVALAIIPMFASVLEGNRNKIVYTGILAGLIVIAGGGSRGSMAVVGGGIAVLTILSLARRTSPWKFKILGLAMLAAAVIVPLSLATLKDRFGDTPITAEEQQRAAFERAARAMAVDYPLGVGANLYVPVANLQGYADKAGVAWNFANRSAPVHNAFLLARAETGWAGEVAYVLLFVVPLLSGLRIAFANRKGIEGGIALGSSVALMAVMVHSLYEYAAHAYNPQALIFLNLAIIAGYMRDRRLAGKTRRVKRMRPQTDQPLTQIPASPKPVGGAAQ